MNTIDPSYFRYRDISPKALESLLLPSLLRSTIRNFLLFLPKDKTIENLTGEKFEECVAEIKRTYPYPLSEEIWQDHAQKIKAFCTDHFSQLFEVDATVYTFDAFRRQCDLEQGYEVIEIPKEDFFLSCFEFALQTVKGIKLNTNSDEATLSHLTSLGYRPLEKEAPPQKDDLIVFCKDQSLSHMALVDDIQQEKLQVYQKEGDYTLYASKKPIENLPHFYGDQYVIFSDR